MSSGLSLIFYFVLLGNMSYRVSTMDMFPKKFVAVQMHADVTLRCDTDGDVTWKHESDEVLETDDIKLKGNELILQDIEDAQMGNYTCWRNKEIVDHTYVLLNMSSNITGSICCTAKTFNCTFNISCEMKHAAFNHFRLRNQRDNSSWVQLSDDGKFYLPHSTNPYAEENEQLVVIGEAVSSSYRYFTTSYSFYLRDIIRPDRPKVNVKNSMVNVGPPSSWAKPTSYYPLDHEIECRNQDDGQKGLCDLDHDKKVPEGTNELRVRCRDSLLLSQWSEWTPWHNVKRKGKEQRKKGRNNQKKNGKKKG